MALVYRDALKPGGYPRDTRWLAGSLADLGLTVTLVTEPGPELDGLSEGVRLMGFGEAEGARFDIVHELFGIFVPGQAERASRMEARVHVISPGAHLMPAHLRRRWWKKVPYLLWWRALHARKRRALHVFSRVELPVAQIVVGTRTFFEAPLGVFPAPPPASTAGRGGLPAGRQPLLFLGRNDVVQKGIDALLAGFGQALSLGCGLDLWIAGRPFRGSDRKIRELARGVGAGERVRLLGEVDEDRKWALLRAARCLVFLSRWDGPPRPIREALAVGTPVIVSPGTNMGSLVSSEEAGLVVPLETRAIAQALLACEDDARISHWREGARRLAQRLSWPKVAESFAVGYETVLAQAE